jgi:hypothetical protein
MVRNAPAFPQNLKKIPFFCNLFHKAFILCKIRVAENEEKNKVL